MIDIVMLLALALALAWGVVLARRIARLQAALLDLAPALQAFCDAVDQSEQSVAQIRQETDRLQTTAQHARSAEPAPREDLVRRFFQTARTRAMG